MRFYFSYLIAENSPKLKRSGINVIFYIYLKKISAFQLNCQNLVRQNEGPVFNTQLSETYVDLKRRKSSEAKGLENLTVNFWGLICSSASAPREQQVVKSFDLKSSCW